MKFYIIILNWNGKDDTKLCISSLLRSNISLSNIIVVDNHSSDCSVDFLYSNFPGIYIIQANDNLGYAGGNNIGLATALENGADAVLLLNNDTEVFPGFFDPLLKALLDSSVGIVGSKIFFYEQQDRIWFGNPIINRNTSRTYDPDYGTTDKATAEPFEVPFVSGCAMAIKRSVIEQIGFLDQDFFCYAEELDYCLRAQKAGFKLLLVPKSKILHKVSGSTGGRASGFTMYYRVRNHLLFAKKNLPLNSWPANSLRNLFIILWHFAALIKSDMNKLDGIRYLILGVADYYRGRFGKKVGA